MTQDFIDNVYRLDWMSDDQWECFQMFADLKRGFHHIRGVPKPCGRNGIVINDSSHGWASFDFMGLTRAIVMAHDRMIRFEIESSAPRLLKFYLHKRHKRDGAMHERHPTIEDAIISIRGE